MAEPAYLTLYHHLKNAIVSGACPYGSRLPGKRSIAAEQGVSVVTAAHALELLLDEGYIETRERSGCYVIYRRDMPATLPAEPPLPAYAAPLPAGTLPFPTLARAMRRVLVEQGDAILVKSPERGVEILRRAIVRHLAASKGLTVTAEQVIIGSGAESLYRLLVDMLGRDLLWGIESPSYEKIEQVYRASGVEVDLLPLGRDGIDSLALQGTKAQVLHVTPYRSFPTGVTASASKRAEYLRWAASGDHILIEDDFESEFTRTGKPFETLFGRSEAPVIYVNSFSRTISPAMRVGYMVLPAELLPRFEATVGFFSCTVPTFEQYVLADLLDSGALARHIGRVRRKLRKSPSDEG